MESGVFNASQGQSAERDLCRIVTRQEATQGRCSSRVERVYLARLRTPIARIDLSACVELRHASTRLHCRTPVEAAV